MRNSEYFWDKIKVALFIVGVVAIGVFTVEMLMQGFKLSRNPCLRGTWAQPNEK